MQHVGSSGTGDVPVVPPLQGGRLTTGIVPVVPPLQGGRLTSGPLENLQIQSLKQKQNYSGGGGDGRQSFGPRFFPVRAPLGTSLELRIARHSVQVPFRGEGLGALCMPASCGFHTTAPSYSLALYSGSPLSLLLCLKSVTLSGWCHGDLLVSFPGLVTIGLYSIYLVQ